MIRIVKKSIKYFLYKIIYKKLCNDYHSITAKYKNRQEISVKLESPYPVWVCWWQGEESMPEVPKMCYSQLLKKSGGHTVNLITKDNYRDFIALPDYIMEKVNNGIITLTHLSDIIRVNLLSKYGGLYMDATVYLLRQLQEFNTSLFSLRRIQDNDMVPKCRWTAFLWYAEKSHILFDFLCEIFFAYWKENDKLIDYFLIDHCVFLACEQIPSIKNEIDNIPFTNPQVHWLGKNMNNEYNERFFLSLMESTRFCKLSNKSNYLQKTKEGLLTYYGYLKNND